MPGSAVPERGDPGRVTSFPVFISIKQELSHKVTVRTDKGMDG